LDSRKGVSGLSSHPHIGWEVGVLVADALDERDRFRDLHRLGNTEQVQVAFHDLARELLDHANDDAFRILVLIGVQMETTYNNSECHTTILVSMSVPRVLLVLLEQISLDAELNLAVAVAGSRVGRIHSRRIICFFSVATMHFNPPPPHRIINLELNDIIKISSIIYI
jgi:hypothetical protein